MIKFFRHIRNNLLSENQISKYVFYALGEILLVVIGILIALQINTWNENKKNRALENQYYCRLSEDALQDLEQVNLLISQFQERKADANQLLRIVLKEEYDSKEILLQYIKTIRGSTMNFTPNDATYEDLKSSGNLGLIRDIHVKKTINNYLRNLDPLTTTNQYYIDYISDKYFELTESSKQTGMISIELATDEVGVSGFKFEDDIVESLKEYEVDQIPVPYRNDFFNLAYNLAVNMERRMQIFESIKKEVLLLEDVLKNKCGEIENNR